jgi:hypothetical protein
MLNGYLDVLQGVTLIGPFQFFSELLIKRRGSSLEQKNAPYCLGRSLVCPNPHWHRKLIAKRLGSRLHPQGGPSAHGCSPVDYAIDRRHA